MKDELTSLRVDQVVHGYAEGHREIAGSMRLKSRDARTMSILSDVSSSGIRIPEHGYLTGYPLAESNVYVLARTWPATEVSRPGAVWTHSLLFAFADLPAVTDAETLLQSFRRPVPALQGWEEPYRQVRRISAGGYPSNTIFPPVSVSATGEDPLERMLEWTSAVLVALYNSPNTPISVPVDAQSSGLIEQITMSMWLQQWPRLRRSFRFCTQSLNDRRAEGAAFDLLLFADNGKAARTRSNALSIASAELKVERPPWIDTALQDISKPGPLRRFLATVGSAAEGGRASFAPLVELYRLLRKPSRTAVDADRIVELVEAELSSSSPALEKAVFEALVPIIPTLSLNAIAYLTDHLEGPAVETLGVAASAAIAKAAWALSKRRFVDLLVKGGVQSTAARDALRELPAEAVVEAIVADPLIGKTLLLHRADLLSNLCLWTRGEEPSRLGLDALADGKADWKVVLSVMAAANSRLLLDRAVRQLGAEVLWPPVIALMEQDPPDARAGAGDVWCEALAGSTRALASVLSSGAVEKVETLQSLASHVTPDTVPNEEGDDPWLIAVEQTREGPDLSPWIYLASFLFARALGPATQNPSRLIEISLNAVHAATANGSLPSREWNLIHPRLPQPGFWSNWDRAERLLQAVAGLYIRRDLSPASFSTLGDVNVFGQLTRAALQHWKGRLYMHSVRVELERSHERSRPRIDLLEQL